MPGCTTFTNDCLHFEDFVALGSVNSFVAEFSLHLTMADNVAFPEMPDVEEATSRRKRFRYA